MAQPTLPEVIQRYKKLDSALIFDTLDAMGLPQQQLDLAIQPLTLDMVIAGPAFTSKWAVSEDPKKVGSDRLEIRTNSYKMLTAMTPGCIYVEDVGNDPVSGGLGENLGISVKLAGAAGVVCDGGTRDKKALIAMAYPVFSRFSSCTFSWGRRRFLDYQIPVRLSGHVSKWVTVHPGDFIFGDCDGVLVIPQALTLEVLEGAEKVAEIEEEQRRRLLAGEEREAVYKVNRYAHIRRVVQ
ncbi:MAG: RraA family protein [Candidatus Methylomirabilales bacterium]